MRSQVEFNGYFTRKIFWGSIFITFCVIVIGATLYYAPGWGVMDDAGFIDTALNFWKHPSISLFSNLVSEHIATFGRFQPLLHLWVISAYSIFRSFPTGAYLCIALIGLAVLLIWGKMINKVFPGTSDQAFDFFIYPLSFFIFTPFWNNFMYISIQEKFVYFFASFALYFYIRAYEANKTAYVGLAFIFVLLGMISKETSIALAGVFCLYSLLDWLVFRKNKRISLVSFVASTLMIIGYYCLIRSIWTGSYSIAYKRNFNLAGILTTLFSAPLIMKCIVVIAVVAACSGIVFFARGKERSIRQEFLLFPFFTGAYLLVLSPRGFSNYYLAPIAPALMLTVYPVFRFLGAGSLWRRTVLKSVLVILIFLVLFFVIIPRISKMGDTKDTVSAIISLQSDGKPAKFFMAPPFAETAGNIQAYAKTEIPYLYTGVLDKDMLKSAASNYIIFEDRCTAVELRDVGVKKKIYSNKTWEIFSLKKSIGKTSVFMPVFEINFLQRIKNYIKSVH